MEDHRSRIVVVVIALLVVLPALYIGSYLALVIPSGALRPTGTPGEYAVEYYRAGGALSATIFWPAEQLDRKIRKQRWEENVLRFWH
jgi:hypothetical protein